MLRSSGRPYVCWRCLTTRASSFPVSGGSGLAPRDSLLGPQILKRHYTNSSARESRIRHAEMKDLSKEDLRMLRAKSDIRERLRAWESENHIPSRRLLQDSPTQDLPLYNYMTRPDLLPGSADMVGGDNDATGARPGPENRALFQGDDLMDIRGATSALKPGDMVETRYGFGRLPVMAICLGRHYGLQYFYMSTGEVVAASNLLTLFTVTEFVHPRKLQPIVDILPEVPFTKPPNLLVHRKDPAALEAVAELQRHVEKFNADSAALYQTQQQLELASANLAHPSTLRYLSLEEIANKLLPKYLQEEDRFPPHALYAVHMALQRDEWGFRPLNLRYHRRNYIYEVRPHSDIRILRKVESQVRELIEAAALRANPAASESLMRKNSLGAFIMKSRAVIQASRQRREWTPHGMLGPCKGTADDLAVWNQQDLEYIRFMELWTCHRVVPTASQLETMGAAILRLTDSYNESDWLAYWTGFTFLQEIGWIPPYDIPARYEYRFPDTKVQRGAAIEMPTVNVKASLRPDVASGHRRDWGDTTVFCVDSEQTADVDDGFSIEATEKAGEYWIHIHIADPASVIDPKSELARRLQLAPSSLYLPGFPGKMLPRELEEQFSLNPGQPALTFSAKVDELGKMLDYKVEPSILRTVKHVPKDEVAAILPGLRSQPKLDFEEFAVGTPPEPPAPVKHIIRAINLPQKDRDDLVLLHRLCAALKERRVANGQLPPFQARIPSTEVSFDSVTTIGNPDEVNVSVTWLGDPFIRLSESVPTAADRLVERLMHTAGEVAARWCSARRIPIPYSTQPEAMRNVAELESFRRQHIDPVAAQGKPVPVELLQTLYNLVGTSELSVDPARFYSVGLDAYAKSSSPLRRFADLIVHWQIHAALAREREIPGNSLAGTDCSEAGDFLPWTRSSLAPALPMLQALQRQIKQVDNRDGPTQWIAQALLRAWRFGEAPLPQRFTFVVDAVMTFGLRGRLVSFYHLSASIDLPRLDGITRMADVRVDDLFEVEIVDVNVVTSRVSVNPLRRLEAAAPRQGSKDGWR